MDRCVQMRLVDRYCECLEWTALREGFRKARLKSGKSLRKLKQSADIDPSTIHRIENIKKYPDYRPDLDTLDALVRGVGLTLAQFFAQVEGLTVQETPAAGPASLPSPSQEALRIGMALATALEKELQHREQTAESPHESPQGGRTKSGRGRRR